jgi:hypothetical protein
MNRCNSAEDLVGSTQTALGRMGCHKYWRAARTAAGQRRQCRMGVDWRAGRASEPIGTRPAHSAAAAQGKTACESEGWRVSRSEAAEVGERTTVEEKLLEARGGDPRAWKRKEIQVGAGRGRYYFTAVPEEPNPPRRFLYKPCKPHAAGQRSGPRLSDLSALGGVPPPGERRWDAMMRHAHELPVPVPVPVPVLPPTAGAPPPAADVRRYATVMPLHERL